MLQLLGEMLGADHHTVDTVSDGTQALEVLRRTSYDLILSDVRMPYLDGPGLYRAGMGGVRLEDVAIVTEDGLELVTDYPYGMEP